MKKKRVSELTSRGGTIVIVDIVVRMEAKIAILLLLSTPKRGPDLLTIEKKVSLYLQCKQYELTIVVNNRNNNAIC